MVEENTSNFGTAFTVSIEARGRTTTGISAADRAATVLTAIDPATKPADLVRPGHMFPLRARSGAASSSAPARPRPRSTSRASRASIPSAVHLRDHERRRHDGPRPGPRAASASARGLVMVTVADLIRYRLQTERLVHRIASPHLPTRLGDFHLHAYRSEVTHEEHLALVHGEILEDEPVLVRVHSPVPDRRRLRLGPLRLRRAARARHGDDRRGRPRRLPLPAPGGARHRPHQQAPGLRAPGPGARHRRPPTRSSASRPTSATTASAARSSATWACARCA